MKRLGKRGLKQKMTGYYVIQDHPNVINIISLENVAGVPKGKMIVKYKEKIWDAKLLDKIFENNG